MADHILHQQRLAQMFKSERTCQIWLAWVGWHLCMVTADSLATSPSGTGMFSAPVVSTLLPLPLSFPNEAKQRTPCTCDLGIMHQHWSAWEDPEWPLLCKQKAAVLDLNVCVCPLHDQVCRAIRTLQQHARCRPRACQLMAMSMPKGASYTDDGSCRPGWKLQAPGE